MRRERCILLLAILLILDWAVQAQPKGGENSTIDVGCGMAKLVKRAQASVVSVRTFLSECGREWSRVGSGFIYSEDGFIVTRRSVVQSGDSIVVTLADGRSSTVWVVHYDENTEVALLNLPLPNLLPIPMGESSELALQSQLTVLGNSLGVFPSVTLGTYLGRRPDGMLELSCVIPPGNCGSPVLDETGHIVGILAGRVKRKIKEKEESKMGVVLPIEKVRDTVDKILKHLYKVRGWVGISVIDLEYKVLGRGVRVVGVVPGGPAARAEICTGDTVVEFDGQSIHNAKELADWVKQTSPNHQAVFLVRKGEKEIAHRVRVGAMPWSIRKGMIRKP